MRDSWRPIESGPKDGTRVLLRFAPGALQSAEHIEGGRWERDKHARKPAPYWEGDCARIFGIRTYRANPPTHWQPLDGPDGVMVPHECKRHADCIGRCMVCGEDVPAGVKGPEHG